MSVVFFREIRRLFPTVPEKFRKLGNPPERLNSRVVACVNPQ